MKQFEVSCLAGWLVATASFGAAAQEPGKTVFRCPGPPVLYTDTLSAQEAKDRGCTTIEGAPLTIVQVRKPTAAASGTGGSPQGTAAPRSADSKVDPAAQRARDSDSRGYCFVTDIDHAGSALVVEVGQITHAVAAGRVFGVG